MKDCVLYRLPYAKQAYKIEGETTHLLSSAAQLDDVCGFVMAPFRASAEMPIVVVEGKAKPVELATESWTNEVAETGRREDYARDFARFHDAISKGQFSKLVLSRNAEIAADDEFCPELLFAEACRRYPRMTIALVKSEVAGTWLMATPEILLPIPQPSACASSSVNEKSLRRCTRLPALTVYGFDISISLA